jgi:hypothetical protein
MPAKISKSEGQLIREFRSGHVRLSVWENSSATGKYHSYKLVRFYKDDAGKWQRTDSFKSGDLLDVAAVCQMAHFEYGISHELPVIKT